MCRSRRTGIASTAPSNHPSQRISQPDVSRAMLCARRCSYAPLSMRTPTRRPPTSEPPPRPPPRNFSRPRRCRQRWSRDTADSTRATRAFTKNTTKPATKPRATSTIIHGDLSRCVAPVFRDREKLRREVSITLPNVESRSTLWVACSKQWSTLQRKNFATIAIARVLCSRKVSHRFVIGDSTS